MRGCSFFFVRAEVAHKPEIGKKVTTSDQENFTKTGCLEPLEVSNMLKINHSIQIWYCRQDLISVFSPKVDLKKIGHFRIFSDS